MLKILTLNCQQGYRENDLREFFQRILPAAEFDVLLLQELSRKVRDILQAIPSPYLQLQPNNESQVGILYRQSSVLRDQAFLKLPQGYDHTGFIVAKVTINGQTLLAGSLHCNAGVEFATRKKQLMRVKDFMLDYNRESLPTIIGGDFNSSPGEVGRNNRLMAPQFSTCTPNLGPTCDLKYTEPGNYLLNYLGKFLVHTGIPVRFSVDHIYADKKLAAQVVVTKALPDRVSDHLPVSVTIGT